MSRALTCRWELTGTLVALSPVHVGNLGTGTTTELIQARDGLDQPVLPGTALAGVIRSALPGDWGRHRLWGKISGRTDKGADDRTGESSWIWVDDATAPKDTRPEYRDTTSIDRLTGSAAHGHLFTREILPAGTTFGFRLVVDDDATADKDQSPAHELIEKIAALLRGPGIAVGSATTRGLGRVRLADAVLRSHDLSARTGLIATLREQSPTVELRDADPDALPDGTVRVRIGWRPKGALLVRVAIDAHQVSAQPLTTMVDGEPRLVLPGSTIKGVLRSHAERIMRTVTNKRADEKFLEQMKAEGLGPIVHLFGTANDTPSDNRPDRGRRGAVTAHECFTTHALPTEAWDAVRLPPSDPEPEGPPPAGSQPDRLAERRARQAYAQRIAALNDKLLADNAGLRFQVANHVAVDRWTGGAADGLLFAVLEPHVTGNHLWQDIVLDIDATRLDEESDRALTLLLLVLRDLCDGWISIGHGTTRGMGAVAVSPDSITFSGTAQSGPWSELANRTLAELLADTTFTEPLVTAWLAWLDDEGTAA